MTQPNNSTHETTANARGPNAERAAKKETKPPQPLDDPNKRRTQTLNGKKRIDRGTDGKSLRRELGGGESCLR